MNESTSELKDELLSSACLSVIVFDATSSVFLLMVIVRDIKLDTSLVASGWQSRALCRLIVLDLESSSFLVISVPTDWTF